MKNDRKWKRVQLAFEYLQECEANDEPMVVQDISLATGLKEVSIRTYITKRWDRFLVPDIEKKNTFKVLGVQQLTFEEFKVIHSQTRKNQESGSHSKYSNLVTILLNKARHHAILAVSIYNNPTIVCKTEGYIVHVVIAWIALYHAIFESSGIDYWYKNEDGTPKQDKHGEMRYWELSTCCKEYFKGVQSPIVENLLFLTGLRNKISHSYLPYVDPTCVGECQACLSNFEDLIVSHFDDSWSLNVSLAVSLQLSGVSSQEQVKALKALQSKNYTVVKNFIEEFRERLPESIISDQKYRTSVYLVPKINANSNVSDMTMEFVRFNDVENHQGMIAVIKEKRSKKSVYKFRPSHVVERVSENLNREFNQYLHTKAWKYYDVRPSGSEKIGKTKEEYCGFLEGHEGYLYTQQWIDFLVKELSDDKKYNTLKGA